MIGFTGAWLVAPLAAGLAFNAAITFHLDRKRAYRRRSAELHEAVTLMTTHAEALREFLDLDVAISLRETLIEFSKRISDEASAAEFTSRMVNHMSSANDAGEAAQGALRDLMELRESWPGKAQIFDRAITSGLLGTFFRWPSVGKLFKDGYASLAVYRERDVAEVVRAADSNRNLTGLPPTAITA